MGAKIIKFRLSAGKDVSFYKKTIYFATPFTIISSMTLLYNFYLSVSGGYQSIDMYATPVLSALISGIFLFFGRINTIDTVSSTPSIEYIKDPNNKDDVFGEETAIETEEI